MTTVAPRVLVTSTPFLLIIVVTLMLCNPSECSPAAATQQESSSPPEPPSASAEPFASPELLKLANVRLAGSSSSLPALLRFSSPASSPSTSLTSTGSRRSDKTLTFPSRVLDAASSLLLHGLSKVKARKSQISRMHAQQATLVNQISRRGQPEDDLVSNDDDLGSLLPECASQQVCAAVHVRFNSSTPLCSCPRRFGEQCSKSLKANDGHSLGLVTETTARPLTLVKMCEPTKVLETCENQKDWSLFAMQNTRTRKAHYMIICACPIGHFMEGPIEHAAPEYAQVPGIRIFGMMCVSGPYSRKAKHTMISSKDDVDYPPKAVWDRILDFLKHLNNWT